MKARLEEYTDKEKGWQICSNDLNERLMSTQNELDKLRLLKQCSPKSRDKLFDSEKSQLFCYEQLHTPGASEFQSNNGEMY